MKPIILKGDPTSHGGEVLTGSDTCLVQGKPVARQGDLCSCPREGHEHCTIAEGDPKHLVGGRPIAYEGCRTSCGAELIATQGFFHVG